MSAVETLRRPRRGERPRPGRPKVLGWRIEQLLAAGFDSDAAFVLALDRNVDLHEAIELVGRGCPPATALRILDLTRERRTSRSAAARRRDRSVPDPSATPARISASPTSAAAPTRSSRITAP